MSIVVKRTETGALVRSYDSNPETGYVILVSEELQLKGTWASSSVRTHIMKGKVELLEKWMTATKGVLAGRIQVVECVEDDIPQEYAERLNKKISFEEAISYNLKKTSEDGVVLTKEGKRILRFTNYDLSGNEPDVLVQHDNHDEIAAWKLAQKDAKPRLGE